MVEVTAAGGVARSYEIELDETVPGKAVRANPSPAPRFVWVHYFDPHAPYEAPSEYAARFEDACGITQLAQVREGNARLQARNDALRIRLDGDVAELQRFSIDTLFAGLSSAFGLAGALALSLPLAELVLRAFAPQGLPSQEEVRGFVIRGMYQPSIRPCMRSIKADSWSAAGSSLNIPFDS